MVIVCNLLLSTNVAKGNHRDQDLALGLRISRSDQTLSDLPPLTHDNRLVYHGTLLRIIDYLLAPT
jgi:hypothetical protein